MKTIGRILIILVVFFILASLMVVVVNASGANATDFNGARQFRPGGTENGIRPQGDGDRPERGERGVGGSRWMFGLIKNVSVMALLVIIIVWPKSVAKKKRKQSPVKPTVGET
jgi:hypothetical protein